MTTLPSSSLPTLSSASSGRVRVPSWVIGLIVPVGLAVIYELMASYGMVETRLKPPPSVILATLWKLAETGELWKHIIATLTRVGIGFVIGAVVATLVGVITGYWRFARDLFDPTFQALRAVPSIAWVPLFILWFGIFEAPKLTLIAVGVFFPVYLTLSSAIRDADRKLVEVGRLLNFTAFEQVRRIIFPSVLPAYLTGLRGGLGLGWMFVVAAEIMGASEGLGYLLVEGQQSGNPATIVASIVTFAILGKLTDFLVVLVSHRLLVWRDNLSLDEGR